MPQHFAQSACCCHESGCHSLHLLHHTTAAHHLWTASPIIHCTHTFPSTITPITQLSPITHLSWLSYHTCTSFTHTHIKAAHFHANTAKSCSCPGWHFWALFILLFVISVFDPGLPDLGTLNLCLWPRLLPGIVYVTAQPLIFLFFVLEYQSFLFQDFAQLLPNASICVALVY